MGTVKSKRFTFPKFYCQILFLIGLILSNHGFAIELYEPNITERTPAEVTVRHESGQLETLAACRTLVL